MWSVELFMWSRWRTIAYAHSMLQAHQIAAQNIEPSRIVQWR
jgi:hypothetical protein